MNDNLDIRGKARALSDKKAWSEALPLYEQLYAPKCDKWLAWEYSRCLKNLSKIDKAIEISKELFLRDRKFAHNNDLLAWLLYEKHFKTLKDDYNYDELNNLYRTVITITKVIEQKQTSAYQPIIIKMLKLLNKHGNNPHEKMLTLLDKLDVSMLSEQAGTYKQGEREKEYRSNKEMYYSYKTKALLSCGRYDDCVLCCDEAIASISSFHNDIDIWILSRKALSLAKVNDFDGAIRLLKDMTVKKEHFSLLENLADIYLLNEDNESALLYYCRAALTKEPSKMKVSLYQKIADLLYKTGDTENAWKHAIFIKQIRIQNDWKLTDELQSLYNRLAKSNTEQEVKPFVLKEFWLSKIYIILGLQHGIVSKLNVGGKTGFIKTNKTSRFFKVSSLSDQPPIKQNDKVKFVLIDSFNAHKSEYSKECAYIKFDKN